MLRTYNHEKVNNIIIKICLSSKHKDTYYMLWEVENSQKFDFLAALKDVVDLEDWSDYVVGSEEVCVRDQESFYCAVLLYLEGYYVPDEGTNPMIINIQEKTNG